VFKTGVRERYQTERYNEQISLMCNMQGAEMLMVLGGASDVLQAVYRVHDAPLKKNLNALRNTLDLFAKEQNDSSIWEWKKDQPLAEYLDQLPSDPENKPKVRAVQRQIMQAQRGSSYEPEPSEHHALKAASYARFSSPMREVVGIFTHKEIFEALGGHAIDNETDEALRIQVIEAATHSRQKQRQLDKKIKLAALHQSFAKDLVKESPTPYTGTIVGIRKDRLYISLNENALEIKIYKNNLDENYSTTYEFSAIAAVPTASDQPSYGLGDPIALSVQRYDNEKSRYHFKMALIKP